MAAMDGPTTLYDLYGLEQRMAPGLEPWMAPKPYVL